ncbi:hypothetical protein MIR68_007885 [Amoeboaphelidium protococcarum]|nr:hypothetical protein MIR68_007885 [Amoeboaphelidium protococcarum]
MQDQNQTEDVDAFLDALEGEFGASGLLDTAGDDLQQLQSNESEADQDQDLPNVKHSDKADEAQSQSSLQSSSNKIVTDAHSADNGDNINMSGIAKAEVVEKQHQISDELSRFRKQMVGKVPYSANELLRLYERDCRNSGIQPIPQLVKQLQQSIELQQQSQLEQKRNQISTIQLERVQFIDKRGVETFCDFIILAFKVRKLRLHSCTFSDQALASLIQAILTMDTLPWLSLSQMNGVSFTGHKSIAKYISTSQSCRYLDLSQNQVDTAFALLLRDALVQNSKSGCIEVLRLDGCSISSDILQRLVGGISASNIRVLSLRNNSIDQSGPIGTLLGANKLTKLDLAENYLGMAQLDSIFEDCRSDGTLHELSLANNGLKSHSLSAISQFLSTNLSLTLLDLSNNSSLFLDPAAAQQFKQGLVTNRSLHTLYLENVGLTAEGAISIAEALAENKSLRVVSLLGNEAAINPLLANYVNIPQNIMSYGQKFGSQALKFFGQGLARTMDQIEKIVEPDGIGKTQRSNSQVRKDNWDQQIPTAQELAMSAFMAIYASLKLNTTVQQVFLLDPADFKRAQQLVGNVNNQSEQAAFAKQILAMINDIQNICDKNAKIDSMKVKAGVAQIKRADVEQSQIKDPTLTLDQIQSDIDIARQLAKDFKAITSQYMQQQGSSSSEAFSKADQIMDQLKDLHSKALTLKPQLLDYTDRDVVVYENGLSDRLLIACAELENVEAIYSSISLKKDTKTEQKVVNGTPEEAFSIGDD